MKKSMGPIAGASAAVVLAEAVAEVGKIVDRLLSAYQRQKELEIEMLKVQAENEQELKRLENSRIELKYAHDEKMRLLDDINNILQSHILNDEANRKVFIEHSNQVLDTLKKLEDAAFMEKDHEKRKDLFNMYLIFTERLQTACDKFQQESTKRYVEGSADLKSIPLTEKTVKKIGENK